MDASDWKILEGRVAGSSGKEPLQGFALFVIQHVLDDLQYLVRSFNKLGCDFNDITIVGIPYSSRSSVGDELRLFGCHVEMPAIFPFDGCVCTSLIYALERARTNKRRLIIIEDGGYAVPLISQLALVNRIDPSGIVGAVEQTSRGVWIDRRLQRQGHLQIPVISIPDCLTKRKVEPPYIANAVRTNLTRLLNAIDSGIGQIRTVGCFGYGTIGELVARRFRGEDVQVYVTDPDPEKRYSFLLEGGFEELTEEHIGSCDLLLGATGSTSMGARLMARVRDNVILGSISSRQVEIDIDWLHGNTETSETPTCYGPSILQIPLWRKFHYGIEGASRSVTVLYDGYPLNFSGPSLPAYVADAILSLLLEGAITIAKGELGQCIVYPGKTVLSGADTEISLMFRELKPNDGINLWTP